MVELHCVSVCPRIHSPTHSKNSAGGVVELLLSSAINFVSLTFGRLPSWCFSSHYDCDDDVIITMIMIMMMRRPGSIPLTVPPICRSPRRSGIQPAEESPSAPPQFGSRSLFRVCPGKPADRTSASAFSSLFLPAQYGAPQGQCKTISQDIYKSVHKTRSQYTKLEVSAQKMKWKKKWKNENRNRNESYQSSQYSMGIRVGSPWMILGWVVVAILTKEAEFFYYCFRGYKYDVIVHFLAKFHGIKMCQDFKEQAARLPARRRMAPYMIWILSGRKFYRI